MGLLDMCCPKKPKMTLDYVIKWVKETDKTLKEVVDWMQEIKEMDLQKVFDDYARDEYDWSQVPEFDAKADKVENSTEGNFASLDSEGNLQDSGKSASDFAPATHTHFSISKSSGPLSSAVLADVNSEQGGFINLSVSDLNGTPINTPITYSNIRYLQNLLSGIDTTPMSGSTKLITSDGVLQGMKQVRSFDAAYASSTAFTVDIESGAVTGITNKIPLEARFPIERKPYTIALSLTKGGSSLGSTKDATFTWQGGQGTVSGTIFTPAYKIGITGTVSENNSISWGEAQFTKSPYVDTIPTQDSPNLITSGAVYNAINAIPTQEVFNIKIVYVSGRYRLLFESGVYSHGPIVLPSSKIVTVSNVLEYDHDTTALVEETFLGLFHYETQEGTYPIRIYIQVGGSCLSFSGDFYTLPDNRVAFIPGDGTAYTYEGSNYNYSDASGYIVTFPPQS